MLGELGGNFTQSLGNLNVLFQHPNRKITLLSDSNAVFLLPPGDSTIEVLQGAKVGLIPVGNPCKKATTHGLKWNISKLV